MAGWLRELGLGQYEPAFRENDIDFEVLRSLTIEDLRDLGIASIGHRRRLLDAIKALPAEATPTSPAAEVQAGAERRQLTVMFCDLAGSTALSSRLDPEDLRELLGSYHAAVGEAVAGFDGYVAKYMGDGVLDLFRLSASARGRCRAGGARRAGARRAHRPAGERLRRAGEPHRHRHRARRRRRPDRRRRRSGARRCRRDAQPCRPSPRNGAGEWCDHRRGHAPPAGRSLRISRSRHHRGQRVGRPGSGVAGAAAQHGREPVRGIAIGLSVPTRRARRGDRAVAASLGARQGRRRADRTDLGRARHRQIPHHRGLAGAARRANRISGCTISARRIIATVRSIRSLPSSNTPPAFRARTPLPPSATSSLHCYPNRGDSAPETLAVFNDLLGLPTEQATTHRPSAEARANTCGIGQAVRGSRATPANASRFRRRALDRLDLARIVGTRR